MTDQTTTDFDGCHSACRAKGVHTLIWGGCEHAPEPEPTVSLSRTYTAADRLPAICFDTYTVPQLAELIAPALTSADPGWPIPLDAVTAHTTALRIAGAIVHRHDEQRPAIPVPAPPPDQSAEPVCVCGEPESPDTRHRTDGPCYAVDAQLRVAALAIARTEAHEWADGERLEDKPLWQTYLAHAAAVLAVLPPAADRGAVLLEVADWLKAWRPEFFERWAVVEQDRYEGGVDDAADELRRLAAEAQQQGATTVDKAAALGLTDTEYRARSHEAAVAAVRAAIPGMYAAVGFRLQDVLNEAAEAQQPGTGPRPAATEATESSTGHPPGCWYDAEAAEQAMLEERPEGQRTRARAVEAEKHDYIDAVECAIGLTVDCCGTPGVHRVRNAVLAVRDREMNRLRTEVGRLGDWCRTVSDHATTTAAERDRYHAELAINEKDRVATLQRATQYADLLTQAHQIISVQKDLIGAERRIVATALDHRDQEHVKATACPGCDRDHLTELEQEIRAADDAYQQLFPPTPEGPARPARLPETAARTPRQRAYEAVNAYLESLGDRLPTTKAARTAQAWLVTNTALEAAGLPTTGPAGTGE